MVKKRIVKIAVYVFGIVFAISFILNLTGLLDRKTLISYFIPYLLTTANFIAGFYLINYGITKKVNVFLISVFGGMVARLFLVLLGIIITIKFFVININIFIFVIFICYILYLTIEVLYLNYLKGKFGKL